MTTIINPIDNTQDDICKSTDLTLDANYSTSDAEISKMEEEIDEVRI
jgi:hypothetical protein